jgi:glutathione S-transferase
MVTLHIANKNYSSWSLRPWVLMRMLGLPFVERQHYFAPGSNYETFRGFSPTGRVPCLVDGDVVVWDSLAIVEYLHEGDARIWPADRAARAWARAVAAEMHSGFSALRTVCSMNCGVTVRLASISEALAADIARLDEIFTEGPARFGGPFLAGPGFTAADAFFCPVAFRIRSYGLALSAPAMVYVERLLALPAMRDWYAGALAETRREPAHETNIAAYGTLVADLRA